MAAVETPRAVQIAIADLTERIEALETQLAHAQAAALTGKRPAKAPAQGKARWLESARFANACQGTCSGRVEKGERAWYVPGVGVYHEKCAPPEARA